MECRVGCARLADCEGRDRNSARHLHNREQRILALKMARGYGHAQDRHDGLGREHAGQMRCAARTGNDGAQAAPLSGLCVIK